MGRGYFPGRFDLWALALLRVRDHCSTFLSCSRIRRKRRASRIEPSPEARPGSFNILALGPDATYSGVAGRGRTAIGTGHRAPALGGGTENHPFEACGGLTWRKALRRAADRADGAGRPVRPGFLLRRKSHVPLLQSPDPLGACKPRADGEGHRRSESLDQRAPASARVPVGQRALDAPAPGQPCVRPGSTSEPG
jgi:hypothetical protein